MHEWILDQGDDLSVCNGPEVPTRVVSYPDLTLARGGVVSKWGIDPDSTRTRCLADHLAACSTVLEMFDHLGPIGRPWLFYIVRRSISTGMIPQE